MTQISMKVTVFYMTELLKDSEDGKTHYNALPQETMWSAKTLSTSFPKIIFQKMKHESTLP